MAVVQRDGQAAAVQYPLYFTRDFRGDGDPAPVTVNVQPGRTNSANDLQNSESSVNCFTGSTFEEYGLPASNGSLDESHTDITRHTIDQCLP